MSTQASSGWGRRSPLTEPVDDAPERTRAAVVERVRIEAVRGDVPELGDPARLMDAIAIRRATRDATAEMIKKVNAQYSTSALEVAKQIVEIASKVNEIAEVIAG